MNADTTFVASSMKAVGEKTEAKKENESVPSHLHAQHIFVQLTIEPEDEGSHYTSSHQKVWLPIRRDICLTFGSEEYAYINKRFFGYLI